MKRVSQRSAESRGFSPGVPGHFAERHFAERHFAERHFAERTFCRTDILPTDILPNGRFAELGRRMSIQKMQFRCTPRGTT